MDLASRNAEELTDINYVRRASAHPFIAKGMHTYKYVQAETVKYVIMRHSNVIMTHSRDSCY